MRHRPFIFIAVLTALLFGCVSGAKAFAKKPAGNPNASLPQVLMRIKNGITNYYIYGAGLMYQTTERATGTNTLTYHYDYRGSTVALSSDSGLVTDRVEYSLYGSTTYRAGTNDTPFLFDGQYGVQTDPNGLLSMRALYCNPYLCRFISPDPSGFKGGLNFYAYANGNPVSYVDPFGLGALGESALTSSWFDAPTAAETETQNILADFVNIATLGAANLASSLSTGQDLQGNNLDFGDAFNQTLEAGSFVASLALALPTDGTSLDAEAALNGGTVAADSAAIRWGPLNGPGPLGESVANTFRGGSYTESVLSEDTTLYRVYGGNSQQIGPYWTRTAPAGPLQSTIDSALNPAWGNTAQNVTTMVVPKGTTIYEGFAAPQGGLLGGGNQVVIPTVNPAWLIKP